MKDRPVHRANRDRLDRTEHRDRLVLQVLRGHRGRPVRMEAMERQVRPAHRVRLVRPVGKGRLDLRDYQGRLVPTGNADLKDHQVRKEKPGHGGCPVNLAQTVSKDPKDRKVHPESGDLKGRPGRRDQPARERAFPDQWDRLVHRVHRDRRESKDPKAHKDHLGRLARMVLMARKDHRVRLVPKGHRAIRASRGWSGADRGTRQRSTRRMTL